PTHDLIAGADAGNPNVVTPEQVVVEGKHVGDRVVVYDADGYYVAASMAELLARQGKQVTYVTPFDGFAPYLRFTLEEHRQYRLLDGLGVDMIPANVVVGATPDSVAIE